MRGRGDALDDKVGRASETYVRRKVKGTRAALVIETDFIV